MGTQLAKILIDSYGLKEEEFSEAQKLKVEKGGNIGAILVQQKNITEEHLLEAFSAQYDLQFWPKLPPSNTETGFTEKIGIQFLKKY